MDKILKLYTYVDGGINDTPFPNAEGEPIEIGAFRYDAKRMGGAPTIIASVNYPSCLDDVWTDNVYAEFNGEKYFLKQTPTSSYDNQDTMYKHDLELVSERVALDNVYFFDVVTGNPQGSDKPVSNSTKVVFFGDIREFASRLQDSLEYSGLGYTVVVDDDIETEEKLMSFEDQFFSNVLQEIYNTFEVPYYFDGKVIHIGYSKEGVVIPDLAYGVDNALLSITKNNANYKIVNRATGTGSSDNIPFYYPNNSPKGEIAATPSGNFEVKILDAELYSNEIKLDGVIRKSNVEYENAKATFGSEEIYSGETFSAQMGAGGINKMFGIEFTSKDAGIFLFSFSSSVTKYILKEEEKSDATFGIRYFVRVYDRTAKKYTYDSKGSLSSIEDFEVQVPYANHKYEITIECYYAAEGKYAGKGGRIAFNASYSFGSKSGWMYEDKVVDLKDVGLEVVGNTVTGDTITQTLVKYVKTSQKLLPSVYRETDGKERFYNATNGTYEEITFNNPFVEGHPKEHIITVEDIKPSIKEMVNSMGLRMDMFSEFAYDLDDNDELVENEEGSEHEYVHSYFFAKLRKLDFNLFDHAIEQQPMTISFTSGDCGACNFEIGVTEEFPQKNPVQVNADGTLKRDEKGRVVCGQFEEITEDECQPQQQDTINNEVWIALKKEDSTYGILMPKAPTKDEQGKEAGGHRPKACSAGKNDGDTFVILGINLPLSYILNAEKKLEAEIIKYLQENNDEKFTFSIGFSRIFFEENATVLNQLSENSKIRIIYDEKPYDLYVSSFSYNMAEGDALPEIRVELDETLKVSQNALQSAISQVKSELGRALGNIDVLGAATPYFIRKDADDEARGKINFTKGIKFGEGGKVEVLDNNSAKLTIEYLEVTKKASFTSLEIKEKTHVGGQIIISPAAMTCGEVEELDSVYRCYFQTKGADGSDEIFNQFAVNDLAICQTYNAWGSRYYWRKVVGVGEDYIDLSKTICDEGSDIPMAGDKIVQLGNTEDTARQAAQVLSAYGEDAPSFVMYNGINDFSLEGKNITGIIWNPETQEPQMYSYGSFFFGDKELDGNYITFQKREGDAEKSLHINARITVGEGSDGLSNLSEWQQAEKDIEDAKSNAQEALDAAQQALADMSWLGEDITEINKRLDGVVENYFYEGAPSIYKSPVTDWLSESLEQGNDNVYFNHIGDTYTDIQTYIDDESTPTAGKSWRWCQCETSGGILATINSGYISSEDWYKIGNIPQGAYYYVRCYIGGYECLTEHFSYDSQILVNGGPPVYLKVESATGDVYVFDQYGYLASQTSRYEFLDQNSQYIEATDKEGNIVKLHWHQIADSDAVKALLEASKAQSTADGKSTTYLSKPTNGYKKGDLWILESDTVHSAGKKGDILTANQNSASYVASHWKKVVRYTDDTTANVAKGIAETAQNVANTASANATSAASLANDAKALAEAAKGAAEEAEALIETANNYAKEAKEAAESSENASKLSQQAAETASQAAEDGMVTVEESKKIAEDAKAASDAAQEASKEAEEAAEAARLAAQSAQNLANEAKADAEKAAQDAEQAATDAKNASDRLDEWADDLLVSPSDIPAIENELVYIAADKADIDAQLEIYAIDNEDTISDNFNTAYNAYEDALNAVLKLEIGTTFPEDLDDKQTAYYTQRTVILEAIAKAAKKVADDAQKTADDANAEAGEAAKTAEEAKQNAEDALLAAQNAEAASQEAQQAAAAAQAKANEVSEKIDGDNYFTEIEKKTIRSIIAEITECREKLHENNAIVKFTTKQGHSWYLVEEDSYAEWTDANEEDHSVSQSKYAGYYSSNLHNANSYSVTQVDVELTEGREVDIQLDYFSDAESTNDWMTVGARGTTVSPANTTTTSNTLPNRAGGTYGKQRMVFSKVYNITQEVDAEKRYFQVAYKKNATIDVGTDSAYFRISNPHYIDESGSLHIIELKGSFHRYYLLLKQKGYTEVADMLYDALTEILGLLNANGLWTSGTTELTDGVTFRATLNEYLTDYYAILASCGFDIMDSKVSDFDYLAGALKDGSKTITEGGLVMTSLVAVGDTSTTNVDVEAFMNGSDFCKDNEHGKLIHAMGIPQTVTEDGTEYTDLEKRSKAAQTRIYEDGTIISQNAELNEGCTIGGTVKVTADGIEVDNPDAWGKLTISDSQGLLRNDGNLNVQIGGSCSGAGINISNGTPAHGVCYGRGSADYVCATFATTPGKRAIDIFDGMIGGMRPNTVFKSNGETLTHLDHTCFVSSGSIYLPSDPQIGQNYRIIHTSSSGLRIVLGSADDSSFKNIGSLTLTNSFITSSKIEMIELIYDGINWWYMTSRND